MGPPDAAYVLSRGRGRQVLGRDGEGCFVLVFGGHGGGCHDNQRLLVAVFLLVVFGVSFVSVSFSSGCSLGLYGCSLGLSGRCSFGLGRSEVFGGLATFATNLHGDLRLDV